MAYTTINKSSDYFNTKLYTGTGAELAVSSVGFQPDWVWLKDRGAVASHLLLDAVRGATKTIKSNSANAEGTNAQSLKSFDSDGFTLGTTSDINTNTNNYVSWNWLANGSGSANTDGSISSTVSANTTSGFSVVTYTGNSTAGATIGHGLGVAPSMFIIKNRTTAGEHWIVYHKSLGESNAVYLNLTLASSSSTAFNSTAPTSSVLSVGSNIINNQTSNDYVAYCFAEKKGFSKFGSYTGNGNADGTFVYTGFKPAFVMTKRTDTTSAWDMFDNKREGYNADNDALFANLTNAEDATDRMDLVSNGFKMRISGGSPNYSGGSYIFMAWAEAPLVGSNNVPCTAR